VIGALAATAQALPGALAATAQSAPVTEWGPRILLTLGVLCVIALGIWGMRRGWQARQARQADIPAPAAVPADLRARGTREPGVPGTYVATTTAGDLLDRIVVHGLGNRGRAELVLRSEGLLVDRTGEPPLWIPVESLRSVRLGSGQAQKAYEAGGLILITWQLGDRQVDTGFRADDPEQHIATASALSALVQTLGES
jgi:hypothetical protein